ncbi:hypothetical protein FFJ24_010155 [Pedobacter sp. KBS0701]|uniref:hypothetical protein n=1 Tax=Pedobacter sp. KBS0701 TaxID=2578106 RepID=UPI00110E6C06|nr:hypothetical protein [Pedobacter sp. KBS0701]QDW25153.1 hypothetical protein FFJ24_010155 [Pedobacter sp. KBS0701]
MIFTVGRAAIKTLDNQSKPGTMTENLKQIKAKDLKVGNYLINLGQVQDIDKDPDYYHVVIVKHNEKQRYKFLPGEDLLIFEYIIVDGPMEFLLSSRMRDTLKSMFTTTRIEH